MQEYASDRVIVSFKTDVVVAMAAEEEGLQFMRPAGQQGSVVYSITDGADVADKIKQLEHHPGRQGTPACSWAAAGGGLAGLKGCDVMRSTAIDLPAGIVCVGLRAAGS